VGDEAAADDLVAVGIEDGEELVDGLAHLTGVRIEVVGVVVSIHPSAAGDHGLE
jgi:chloramphenicol 3-O-phosphotransferase